jgi:hypothetical protein
MSKPIFLSICCQAAVMDGTRPDDTTKFNRCRECLQPTTPVRFVPSSVLLQLRAFASAAPPHVVSLDELERVMRENGIPLNP